LQPISQNERVERPGRKNSNDFRPFPFFKKECSIMPRAKRNKAQRATRVHDRKAQDLPLNAEVADVEVDDPLALEPGEKIVTLRSIRNDPLARLHSHHQIDEAQFRGGRAFQDDWEKAERGPRAVDPTREYVDASPSREPITERAGRCCGSTARAANSAPTVRCWCMRF
jgi:hypothetical protein